MLKVGKWKGNPDRASIRAPCGIHIEFRDGFTPKPEINSIQIPRWIHSKSRKEFTPNAKLYWFPRRTHSESCYEFTPNSKMDLFHSKEFAANYERGSLVIPIGAHSIARERSTPNPKTDSPWISRRNHSEFPDGFTLGPNVGLFQITRGIHSKFIWLITINSDRASLWIPREIYSKFQDGFTLNL